MSRSLFVLGTGTDVGKTYVSGLLVKALHAHGARTAYYKAAMSGNVRDVEGVLQPGDAIAVAERSGIPQSTASMCTYVYEHEVSPHLAARWEGNPLQLERIVHDVTQLRRSYDYITMEGAGGVFCPLRMDTTTVWQLDIIRACRMSCVLVGDAGLGTINHIGLTAAYLQAQNVAVQGIILNRFQPENPMHEDNRVVCELLTGIPVVTCVKTGDTDVRMPLDALQALYV